MLEEMQIWKIQRKIHSSWLIAIASASIVIGASAAARIDSALMSNTVWLIFCLILILISLLRSKLYCIPLIIMGGLILGLWRGSVLESHLNIYESIIGQQVTLQGGVSDDPDLGKSSEVILRLKDLQVNGRAIDGKIWVSLRSGPSIRRSDIVTIVGKIQKGFGNFSGVMYQAKLARTMRPQPGDVAGQIRDNFADKVRLAIEEPASSLGLGYLLGQRRSLPPELTQALVLTGLTHVVVASGYNLTILVRLTRRLFMRISKFFATISATLMVFCFMAVTGASPSMSRAGLVTMLSLLAWYYGRRIHPLVLLPMAAAITILIDPSYAWNDLGWQLSFAAFAGVMILAPLLQRYFFGEAKPGTIRQIIGETISAFIVTFPILVVTFGQFSNVAIITNLLILPFIPLAMLLTFISGVGGLIVPSFASMIGAPAQMLLNYMLFIVDYFAKVPWAQSIVQIGPWFLWLSYMILVAVTIYLWRVTKFQLDKTNIAE